MSNQVRATLLKTLMDASRPLTSHYGAAAGLHALGHAPVRLLLLPNLEPYIVRLQPALKDEKNGIRRYEVRPQIGHGSPK